MLAFAAAILLAATNPGIEDEVKNDASMQEESYASELVFEDDLEISEEDVIVLEDSLFDDVDSETAELEE